MSFAAESKITSLPRDRNPPDAAAQGLSIVVPLFNEAASLERLHARLIEVALRLGATRDLSCELRTLHPLPARERSAEVMKKSNHDNVSRCCIKWMIRTAGSSALLLSAPRAIPHRSALESKPVKLGNSPRLAFL
jgi:hypothetical protein